MRSALSDAWLQPLSERVAAHIGIAVAPTQRDSLRLALDELGSPEDATAPAALLQRWSQGTPTRIEIETLARHLAVGETYFFREPAIFEALEHELLPPLLKARRVAGRRLRVWSAGCCSGEEPYSLAITLCRLLPDIADWDIRIVGTDIHPAFLDLARQAIYGEWSFRGVSDELRRSHFDALDAERQQLRPEARRLVAFHHANLLADEPPGRDFDLVLCRHVLMYFGPVQIQRALVRLREALAPGGWLVIGSAEATVRPLEGFIEERHGDTVFLRKPVSGATSSAIHIAMQAPALPARPRPAEEAIRDCLAAISVDKCDPSLHLLHAKLLEAGGRLEEARHALRRALFLDAAFVPAHLALARLCDRQGLPSRARRHVAQALRLLGIAS